MARLNQLRAEPFSMDGQIETIRNSDGSRMAVKLQGLSKRTTTEGLREAFSKFVQVIDARVVTDRVSGFSKGFGFVRYATIEEATEGIKGMDAKFLDGWVIFAKYARPRSPTPPPQPNGFPPTGLP